MWGALITPAETTPRRARPWSKRARVTLKTPSRRFISAWHYPKMAIAKGV